MRGLVCLPQVGHCLTLCWVPGEILSLDSGTLGSIDPTYCRARSPPPSPQQVPNQGLLQSGLLVTRLQYLQQKVKQQILPCFLSGSFTPILQQVVTWGFSSGALAP